MQKSSDRPRRSDDGVGWDRTTMVLRAIGISGVVLDGVLRGSKDRPVWWEKISF